jgi:hypothetical protein
MQSFSDAEQILIGLAAFGAGYSYEEWLAILASAYPHRQQQLAHCQQILQDRLSASAALATAQQPLLDDRWDGSVASSEPAEHIQRSLQLQPQQQLQQQQGQQQPTPRPAGLRSVIRVARTPDSAVTSVGHSPFLQPQLQQTPRPEVQMCRLYACGSKARGAAKFIELSRVGGKPSEARISAKTREFNKLSGALETRSAGV